MKKIYLLVILVIIGFSTQLIAQENKILSITPIKSTSSSANTTNTTAKNSSATAKTTSSLTAKSATVTTTPTGNSTEIGITEGQLSVSLSGAASYNIPIMVPPGINGVVPQISLAYSSQGGNGMAGFGWNIAGISGITRIPSTKYHDGVIDPVDFDSLDRFALDGQRLIAKTGVYGANGTVYETENFSNIKITSYEVHPDGAQYGPKYFVVEYPDGCVAYYGKYSFQRRKTGWGIGEFINPQGVNILYDYVSGNENLLIDSI